MCLFLLQGIGLYDHGSWLGKSEIHRAGCQEGQAVRKGRLETAGVKAAAQGRLSSHKPQFCSEGLSTDCTRYAQMIEDNLLYQKLTVGVNHIYRIPSQEHLG